MVNSLSSYFSGSSATEENKKPFQFQIFRPDSMAFQSQRAATIKPYGYFIL